MKISNAFALGVLFLTTFTSCTKENEVTPDQAPALINEAVAGEVSGTWEKGSTYKVTGDIFIPAGKSLTIQEGVTIEMDTTAKPEVIILGNLYCLGTAASPVTFTVPENARIERNKFGKLWGGLLAGPTSTELVLDHVVLEYGGATTTEASTSVKQGLYKAASGENTPALWFSNVDGKFVVQNSIIRHFQDDCFYLEGGKSIIANNIFHTSGRNGGEAINYKSGNLADVAFNLMYSPNTNALKLANSGDKNPQAHIVAYNNTIVNAGWRRPTIKGGSVWLESSVHAHLYNNLIANSRFGVKRDVKKPEDNRSVVGNTFYYGHTQEGVNQFQPDTEVLAGSGDRLSNAAGQNDPRFVNYPLNTALDNASFNNAWDFHLQAGSPALSAGKTDFTRHFANGLVINGVTYRSPAPANFIGAFGTK